MKDKAQKKNKKSDKKIQRKAAHKAGWLHFLLIMIILAALCACVFCFVIPQRDLENKQEQYSRALVLFEENNWCEARDAFTRLGNFEDSAAKAAEANEHYLSESYESAADLYASRDWRGANAAYSLLGDYKDSASYARVSACCALFAAENVEEGRLSYEELTDDEQSLLTEALGSFVSLAADAIREERYSDAKIYFDLDPESGDSAYTVDLYITASSLAAEQRYDEALELLRSDLIVPGLIDEALVQLKDDCMRPRFEEYSALLDTDAASAIPLLSTITDYEPAADLIRDVENQYRGAFDEMDKRNYDTAARMFLSLNTYENSAEMVKRCTVLEAGRLADKEKSEEALLKLHSVEDFEAYLKYLPEDSALWALAELDPADYISDSEDEENA